MNFDMLHPADQIVMIMNRIYYYGMTTTTGGNLSIRDSEGTVWISPSGVDKGSLRREDIMQIKPDGTIVGLHRPSVEYPFHLAIYKKRPDLRAVLHAHPPALVAFSLLREIPDTSIIPDARFLSGKITIAKYALPGSATLGDKISAEFEKGINTVMLENHGVVLGSTSLFKAFMNFEMLDYCARIQINAKALGGTIHGLSERHMEIYKNKTSPCMEEFVPQTHTSEELGVRRDMCELIHRAYGNQLFTSDQGTFSCKLSDGSFIITPYAKDRKYLEPEDLVLIKDGKCEAGKTPSRSVKLHTALYERDPDIKTVIVAHPPHIMAFAITDKEFDARLIPESYIALKNVRKYPFGSSFMQPEMLAKEISIKNPVVIIENDCIIAAGTSLLNAFDRLEVMEYSAKSLVEAASLGGEVVKISPDEVKEIEVAFNL
ncbi:MAG: class II aldolase/adducin family protein [Clostridiales bacterium]|jgi:class II aldolase/adducin family protein|nr:class II aldolase/adducin family protein [Clostridiales bacterium]